MFSLDLDRSIDWSMGEAWSLTFSPWRLLITRAVGKRRLTINRQQPTEGMAASLLLAPFCLVALSGVGIPPATFSVPSFYSSITSHQANRFINRTRKLH
mmetsp:Transcript_954/g.2747  ORF Transcript_954/g.2747 Transcript_954/m.2747 type:complete len:99 (+) Transcript_954:289-585(+)